MRLSDPVAVILAAGRGVRMKSRLPKVMHPVCGKPMLAYVVDAAFGAGLRRVIVVVGKGHGIVERAFASSGIEFVRQSVQLGTGHAVRVARQALREHRGPVVVLCGDAPLITAKTIRRAIRLFRSTGSACTVVSTKCEHPHGYGRIIRNRTGDVERIVEENDASSAERRVREINSGNFVFAPVDLFEALEEIRPDNEQKELYLTDVVSVLVRKGKKVTSVVANEPSEALGINSRKELALAEATLRERLSD